MALLLAMSREEDTVLANLVEIQIVWTAVFCRKTSKQETGC
ncbi:MAG: hypothetical protein ACOC7K_01305 [bacterium]